MDAVLVPRDESSRDSNPLPDVRVVDMTAEADRGLIVLVHWRRLAGGLLDVVASVAIDARGRPLDARCQCHPVGRAGEMRLLCLMAFAASFRYVGLVDGRLGITGGKNVVRSVTIPAGRPRMLLAFGLGRRNEPGMDAFLIAVRIMAGQAINGPDNLGMGNLLRIQTRMTVLTLQGGMNGALELRRIYVERHDVAVSVDSQTVILVANQTIR